MPSDNRPSLSVVVATYRMAEQIGNTLLSLAPPYQRAILPEEYEIIVMDNGSPEPLPTEVWSVSTNISYTYIPSDLANSNPASALNAGVSRARAPIVCIMIDGARMVTPGVLSWGLRMARLSDSAVTEVRGWHLGPDRQPNSIKEGYTPEVERRLLESVRWYENGYRLFEIAVPAKKAFVGRVKESNCVFIHRSLYERIGGFDERYQAPGGGLVNHDFFWRTVTAAESVFTLLGEGHFHQTHGGAATGLRRGPEMRAKMLEWRAEYARLSRPFTREEFPYDPILVGHVPRECRRWLVEDDPT